MRRQQDFGLLEILVGVGLLASTLGASLKTLDKGFRATATHDQLVTAKSLARAQHQPTEAEHLGSAQPTRPARPREDSRIWP